MNIRHALIVRLAAAMIAAGGVLPVAAQGKRGSLTRDFGKLSAKERSKIAAREAQESAADTAYQRIMRHGDQAFQAKQYAQALALFEQARDLRPYNVYPKVKVEDLQALIKQQEARTSVPAAAPAQPSSLHTQPPPVEQPPPRPVSPPAPAAPPRRVEPPRPEEPSQPVSRPHSRLSPGSTVQARPDGVQERIYREAGAIVVERTVWEEGAPLIYKKVVHPSGQTFYFQGSQAITARQWATRFTE
ncbi:MAG: hypothetical protein IT230_04470 [Flavobacteriales bacterium]|nr:hypothetical protein [Flavobacteriales bacterium]